MAATWWPPALRYEPYPATVDQPNVVVDGSANAASVLTISHWPQAPSPPALARDLSAQMAFAYLDHERLHGKAEIVTNNHFDQDGLVSVYALTAPVEARAARELLEGVASIGDFAAGGDRTAARISMAVAAFADPERSPLGASTFASDYDVTCGVLYRELLDRLPGLLSRPDRYEALWADEERRLDADEAWLATDAVTIEEVPELDLSVVTLPDDRRSEGGHRFGSRWADRIHPVALHDHIDGFAVLLGQGSWWELRYRYESWVQYVSRPVRPRVDLSAAAAELSALEPGAGSWGFEGVDELMPALRPDQPEGTELDPVQVRDVVERALRSLPPAWDPYRREEAAAGS